MKFLKVLYPLFWCAERGFLALLSLVQCISNKRIFLKQSYLSEELFGCDLQNTSSQRLNMNDGREKYLDGRRGPVFNS